MAGLSFAFDPRLGETPETLERRRRVAEALLASTAARTPQTIGEGLTALGAGIGGRLAMNRVDKAEAAGRASGDAAFSSIFGGGGEGGAPAVAEALAGGTGTDALPGGIGGDGSYRLTYANKGATRNLPLRDDLASVYDRAARAAGISEIRVSSGGQPSSGPGRTGSHRHDNGGAGDIQLIANGRVLDMSNPNDLPVIKRFITEAHKLGATGIGAGTDYMGNQTFHVGYGTPAVWGAGGKGANAPQWLREAVAGGDTLRGGAGADVLAAPAPTPGQTVLSGGSANAGAAMPPVPPMRPAQPPAAAAPQPRAMGIDPLPQTTGYTDPVSRAGSRDAVVQALMSGGGGSPVMAGSRGADAMASPVAAGAPPAAAAPMGATAAPPAVAAAPAGAQTAQGGPSVQKLLQAASNPWLSDGQRAVVELLLKQEMAKADPANQLALEKARLEIENLRNPKPDPTDVIARDRLNFDISQAQTTTGIKDYDAYAADVRKAGGTPLGRLEYEQALRQAGATTINTTDTADQAEAKARGAAAVKSFENFANDLPSAQEMATSIDRLDQLAGDMTPGSESAFVNWVRGMTGVELGADAGKIQGFQAAVNFLTPRMRPPGAGATSDFDATMFMNSLPGLLGTPEGNRLAIQTLKGMAQKRLQMGYIAQDYLIGEMDAKTAAAQMRALPDPFAAFKKAEKESGGFAVDPGLGLDDPASPHGLLPGMVEDGYRFKGGNPADKNNWEPVQ